MLSDYFTRVPASKMCEQPGRNGHRRLTFVGFLLALCATVVNAAIEVDIGAADGGDRGGRCNGASAGPTVKAYYNKPCEMPQRPFVRCNSLTFHGAAMNGLHLTSAP